MRPLLLVVLAFPLVARAQAPARPGRAPFELSNKAEYVAPGRLREGGVDSGKAEEFRQDWRLDARRPFGDGRATLGAFYRRTDLGVDARELVPNTLQLIRLAFGYEWSLTDDWKAAAQIAPSLGGDAYLDRKSLSVAGSFIATSSEDASRTWVLGLGVDPRGPIPVIPFVGVILRPDENWTVRLVLPELAVSRKTGPLLGAKSEVKALLKMEGGGYRTSPTFGTARGRPQLDSQWLRVMTMSAGTGVVLVWPGAKVELDAGWAFLRRYDYKNAGVRVTAKGAPFAGFSVGARL